MAPNIRKWKLYKTLACFSVCVLLAACQASGVAPQENSRSSRIDSALARAAGTASIGGMQNASLPYLEKIYKRNSDDPVAAANYAAALRRADHLKQAAAVLAPFANQDEGNAAAKREYAAVQLAMGNNDRAEHYAQKAILADEKDAQAYQYLGIALDSQGMHKEAERAFRKGLDYWQGDPTTIMNNLALNLATQGYLDEALEILQKAKSLAPGRIEVERNLRIVRALQQSHGYRAPKPDKKPGQDS